MGKYSPLTEYFETLQVDDIHISFAQIERIINAKLPPTSFKYREWWSNERIGSHVQAKAWMKAGWKVESVNLSRQLVTFIRVSGQESKEDAGPAKMTLHDAMKDVLESEPHEIASVEKIQAEIIRRNLFRTKKGEAPKLHQVAARANNYSDTFEIYVKLRRK